MKVELDIYQDWQIFQLISSKCKITLDKLGELWDEGKADESWARYLPGLTNISRKEKLYNIIGRRTYASSTYTDKKTLEFTI